MILFVISHKKGVYMESIFIIILKCLLLGIVWAALLIPILFNRGDVYKRQAW